MLRHATLRQDERSTFLTIGLVLAACMALVTALVPAPVEGATPKHNIRAWLDNSCVAGEAPSGAKLWVVWKKSTGSAKKRATVRANQKGRWSLCASGKKVAVGDKVSASYRGLKRTLVVPRLELNIDRDADIISGRSKPRQKLVVQICFWRPQHRDTHCDASVVKTGADGRFSAKATALVTSIDDLVGGDKVEVFSIGSGMPNVFGRVRFTPYVAVRPGVSGLNGANKPGVSFKVDLLHNDRSSKAVWSGKATRFTRTWSPIYGGSVKVGGLFGGQFTPTGTPVADADHVSSPALPPTSGLFVRDFALSADPATDVVTGECYGGERYQLVLTTPKGSSTTLKYEPCSPAGQFTRDVSKLQDLQKGSTIKLTSHFWTGDRVTVTHTID